VESFVDPEFPAESPTPPPGQSVNILHQAYMTAGAATRSQTRPRRRAGRLKIRPRPTTRVSERIAEDWPNLMRHQCGRASRHKYAIRTRVVRCRRPLSQTAKSDTKRHDLGAAGGFCAPRANKRPPRTGFATHDVDQRPSFCDQQPPWSLDPWIALRTMRPPRAR